MSLDSVLMKREITSHQVNGLNEALKIEALGEPGNGGAFHFYRITGICPLLWEKQEDGSKVLDIEKTADKRVGCEIQFQDGPPKDGINGISNEALLAIVEDRLKGFQAGLYASRENAIALTKVQEAMMWLHKRTRNRVASGVEGTLKK